MTCRSKDQTGETHTEILRHGIGLSGKGIKLVSIDGEFLLDRSKRLKVNKEENLCQMVSLQSP